MSHGNSKTGKPFYPTLPSTLQSVRRECQLNGPKTNCCHSICSHGRFDWSSQCPGALPRDEKQVANARQSFKKKPQVAMSIASVGDELFMLMQQSKLGDSQGLFVRELKAAPEPGVVVPRDYQLQDLVRRFCMNEHNFSVLTADPTFCLGDFDVTPITYRHLLLKSRRTDRPPVFVGQLLIHYRKTFSSYLFFSSSLVGLKPELEGVRAFGTDEELGKGSRSYLHLWCASDMFHPHEVEHQT